MAKARRSPAETILEFFENSPIETAQVVLDLVRAVMRKRQGPRAAGTAMTTPRKPGRPKKIAESTPDAVQGSVQGEPDAAV